MSEHFYLNFQIVHYLFLRRLHIETVFKKLVKSFNHMSFELYLNCVDKLISPLT